MNIKGTVIQGYGVASGKGGDERYPAGTIRMQLPFFQEMGLELNTYFLGTINVDIAPLTYQIKTPLHFFQSVKWSPFVPPENFYFFEAQLTHHKQNYQGLIYMPDPKTKPEHHQKPSLLELIMPPIANLAYGDSVEMSVSEESIIFLQD